MPTDVFCPDGVHACHCVIAQKKAAKLAREDVLGKLTEPCKNHRNVCMDCKGCFEKECIKLNNTLFEKEKEIQKLKKEWADADWWRWAWENTTELATKCVEQLELKEKKLRDALIQVKLAIEKNATDTLWLSGTETVCDYIEYVLSGEQSEPTDKNKKSFGGEK